MNDIYKKSQLTPAEALALYTAIKLHFSNERYDGAKYGFKLRKNPDFTKRNDKYLFSKLSRQPDPKGLLVANLSANPKLWVGDLFLFEGQRKYDSWKRYNESLTYCFEEEIKKLNKNSFKVLDNEHPEALKCYISGEVNVITMAILNDFINYIPQWDKTLEDDPVWNQYRFTIVRYKPFLSYNKDSVKAVMKRWLDAIS